LKPTAKGGKNKGVTKAKTTKAEKPAKVKKPSGLDAAYQILIDAGQPMRCKDMVETMLAKGLWTTGGKTPAATIYAAILREIQTKKAEARFKKTDRGCFEAIKR
jgi:HB1, ASXL, restriction endonuclease HTH domain